MGHDRTPLGDVTGSWLVQVWDAIPVVSGRATEGWTGAQLAGLARSATSFALQVIVPFRAPETLHLFCPTGCEPTLHADHRPHMNPLLSSLTAPGQVEKHGACP